MGPSRLKPRRWHSLIAEMSELVFGGVVSRGMGRHKTLQIPRRNELPNAPADWPNRLEPGSLNVRVDRYPSELGDHGLSDQVEQLDVGCFVPEFEIGRGQLGNNQLAPRTGVPRGGDAQVWRAVLVREDSGSTIDCWALRRFGSTVGEQLEFVAAGRLRDLGLPDGARVKAVLSGRWRDA